MDDITTLLVNRQLNQKKSLPMQIGGGLVKGLLTGLYTAGGGDPDKLPFNRRQKIDEEINAELIKRQMGQQIEQQDPLYKARLNLVNAQASALPNTQQTQEYNLQRDELNRQGQIEIERLRQAKTPEEQAISKANLEKIRKEIELIDKQSSGFGTPGNLPAGLEIVGGSYDRYGRFMPKYGISPERKEGAKVEGKKAGAREAFDKLNTEASNVLDKILSDEGQSVVRGSTGWNAIHPAIPNTPRVTLEANIERLKSLLALPNLQYLRGLGAMSDKEFTTISSSVAALNPKMPAADYIAELKRIKQALEDTKMGFGSDTQAGQSKGQGQMMQDANGNKAMVYPDGTFEEVQ